MPSSIKFFQSGVCLTALLALLIAAPNRLFAQAISGDLTGAVLDSTGAAIPNAIVTAQNDATGVKPQAPIGSNGVYRLSNLPVGTYTLSASATGFSTATAKNLKVDLNNTLTQNLAAPSSKTNCSTSGTWSTLLSGSRRFPGPRCLLQPPTVFPCLETSPGSIRPIPRC